MTTPITGLRTGATVSGRAHGAPFVPHLEAGSTIKLFGLGGVGGIVARYGALFLASLGRPARFVLVDGDSFEPGNAGRMVFDTYANKAAVTRNELLGFLVESNLTIAAIEEHVSASNIERLVHDGEIVVLAVDNHATRKLVTDYCAERLRDVCLISGGNDGIEERADGTLLRGTYGGCQVYLRRDGVDITPTLSRYHAEIREPADKAPDELGCVEAAAGSAPQILFANLMAASAILNTLWLCMCDELHYSEVCFDIADGLMRPVTIRAR